MAVDYLGVFSIFDLDATSNDLINSDFRAGIPLSVRYGYFRGIQPILDMPAEIKKTVESAGANLWKTANQIAGQESEKKASTWPASRWQQPLMNAITCNEATNSLRESGRRAESHSADNAKREEINLHWYRVAMRHFDNESFDKCH
ncbi:MAG: DUF1207 domain-containing protein [Promethearchaeota archaeon]